MRKPVFWVSDKPTYTPTEESQNLEILGESRGGIVLSRVAKT